MRLPLSSRTNSRPERVRPDAAPDLVASSTVMVFPSVSQSRCDTVPLASTSLPWAWDLLGRNGRPRSGEIRRTLLEECRKRFLRFCGARPLKELLVFDLDGCFDLADRSPLDEPLARQQCAARFCRQLLCGFGGGREQIPVGHHTGNEAQLGRPRGSEELSQQEQFRCPEM